jgi:hypothetical protein
MTSRSAEKNIKVGKATYLAHVDAEGYPNGMLTWSEMSINDQYWWVATGTAALENCQALGLITLPDDIGIEVFTGEDNDIDNVMDALRAEKKRLQPDPE